MTDPLQNALHELQLLRLQLGALQLISFGKYRGQSFAYVKSRDLEYTEWVCQLKNPNKNQKMFADWVRSTYTIIYRRDDLADFFAPPKHKYENELVGLF